MSQRGLKGLQLREVSSPKRMFETVRDYMTALESAASAGGADSEALTVTGLKADDEIVAVSQMTEGSLGTAMTQWASQADDSLTVTWTGDPGSGAKVLVLVRRLKGRSRS